MSSLFTPLKLRKIEFKNRIFVSPMCQYSSENGLPNEWHLVHLGSRAVGGAALVIVEASAVSPEGRITPGDSGIWSEAHVEKFKSLTAFIKANGSVPGIQIAHAGRKASTTAPWLGGKYLEPSQGGWTTIAPSAVSFSAHSSVPQAMSIPDIEKEIENFKEATLRAARAGFQVLEIHMAHGYLLHEFLSPLSNQRSDEYGGSLEARMKFPLQVAQTVRAHWPAELPLFVRISATDWAEAGGWDLPQSIRLSQELKKLGIDLIDCSSGGLVPHVTIPTAPGYQVPFAEAIKKEVKIATGAVGMITEAHQAENIIASGRADAVLLARELLRHPYWPLEAARILKADVKWPKQYERAANP